MDYLDEQGLATFYAGLQTKFAKSPDWNENDSTSKNYIQNRTHFTEDPVVKSTAKVVDLSPISENDELSFTKTIISASDYPTAFASLFGSNASQYGIAFMGMAWFGFGSHKNDQPTFLERYNETDKVIYSLIFNYYDNNNDEQTREFTRYAGTPNIVSDTNFENETDHYVLVPVEYQHETSLTNIDMIALMPSTWTANRVTANSDEPGPILIFNTINSQQDATNFVENNDILESAIDNIAIMLYTYEQTIHTLSPTYLPPGTMRIFQGMIYHSTDPTSPAELFGGTWERIEGKFLLGATDDGTTGTNILSNASVAAGSSGGEATHQLSVSELASHTHTQNSHNHGVGYRNANTTSSGSSHRFGPYGQSTSNTGNINTEGTTATNQNTGSNTPHNNMPPFLAVYIWKCLEAPTEIVNNNFTREIVFIDVNSGDYILTSAIDSTVVDQQRMCQSNTTMGWNNLTFHVVLADAISANTSIKIIDFSSNCIDIIGRTMVFGVSVSAGGIADVTLNSYDTETNNRGIFISSPIALSAGAEIKCSMSFPVTH